MSDREPTVTFEPLYPDVVPPTRATRGAAGYDVRAHVAGRAVQIWHGDRAETRAIAATGALVVHPGEVALVPLGFRARLPDGYEAQVRLRSSIALRRGLVLPNAPGTIDADYPEEWLVMVRNISAASAAIEHGDRIAQIVLNKYAVLPWVTGTVERSTDRHGGFGSTG